LFSGILYPHLGSDLFELGRKTGIHLITNHSSYRRNKYEAKIKGPDYRFLVEILYKSIALGEDMQGSGWNFTSPRQSIDAIKLHARRTLMSKCPHLYFNIKRAHNLLFRNK
jgi:hypothetical protein